MTQSDIDYWKERCFKAEDKLGQIEELAHRWLETMNGFHSQAAMASKHSTDIFRLVGIGEYHNAGADRRMK